MKSWKTYGMIFFKRMQSDSSLAGMQQISRQRKIPSRRTVTFIVKEPLEAPEVLPGIIRRNCRH
jgi:hypothetical protein